MTTTTPNLHFQLHDDGRMWLQEYADGFRAGVQWLASAPTKDEVHRVARIHIDLRDGGITGCDSLALDADHFPALLAFLHDGPYQREIEDGAAAMAAINARQGTHYPAWPDRCFHISFDEAYLLGLSAACYAGRGM